MKRMDRPSPGGGDPAWRTPDVGARLEPQGTSRLGSGRHESESGRSESGRRGSSGQWRHGSSGQPCATEAPSGIKTNPRTLKRSYPKVKATKTRRIRSGGFDHRLNHKTESSIGSSSAAERHCEVMATCASGKARAPSLCAQPQRYRHWDSMREVEYRARMHSPTAACAR